MMLVTKNLWDLAPGMLLVKEAGGVVKSIYGKEFKVGDCGVVAAATEQLVDVLLTAIND
jgi:fructose-1,6-bisphosphatase/inositol monophosphatase family enzyme